MKVWLYKGFLVGHIEQGRQDAKTIGRRLEAYQSKLKQVRKRIKAEPSHKKQQPLCICQAQWLLPYEIQAVFIFTRSLSAISAINSLLVGLPFPLCIV